VCALQLQSHREITAAHVLPGEEVVLRYFAEQRELYSQQTLSTMDFFAGLGITL